MKNYLSLVKFSHTIFALPFACIGFFLAVKMNGAEAFDPMLFIKVILCMVFARSAAMGFNRYADRDIDQKNPRTALREIPAGVISAQNALFFVIINCILFILTTYWINALCFYLSPVALAVVLLYSYTKRFTALCHFVLGIGLSLAPIGAYLAVAASFDQGSLIAWMFSLIVLLWVAGFDIIYALQDDEFDRLQGLNSMPAKIGRSKALVLSVCLHVCSALLVFYIGFLMDVGLFYWSAATLFTILLVYQHLIVKPNDLSKVDLAFFTTNGIASAIFGVLVVIDLFF